MCLAAPTLVDCGLTVQFVPCVGQRWQRYGQRRLVRELVSIELDAERVLLLIERNAELPQTLSSQTNIDLACRCTWGETRSSGREQAGRVSLSHVSGGAC